MFLQGICIDRQLLLSTKKKINKDCESANGFSFKHNNRKKVKLEEDLEKVIFIYFETFGKTKYIK